jgi:hypothetical protein
MEKQEDVVWALHAFEAENDDELAFEAGERIVVLERDDQYGDGWYQVRASLRAPRYVNLRKRTNLALESRIENRDGILEEKSVYSLNPTLRMNDQNLER